MAPDYNVPHDEPGWIYQGTLGFCRHGTIVFSPVIAPEVDQSAKSLIDSAPLDDLG